MRINNENVNECTTNVQSIHHPPSHILYNMCAIIVYAMSSSVLFERNGNGKSVPGPYGVPRTTCAMFLSAHTQSMLDSVTTVIFISDGIVLFRLSTWNQLFILCFTSFLVLGFRPMENFVFFVAEIESDSDFHFTHCHVCIIN